MNENTREKDEQFFCLYVQLPGSQNTMRKFDTEVEALKEARETMERFSHLDQARHGGRVYVMKATALVEYTPPELPAGCISVQATKSTLDSLNDDRCECGLAPDDHCVICDGPKPEPASSL